ncbi:MAG TPA: exo-alpha-sialidase [Verrucomicrobiae bacterium]|nr:exo-alpha-sialidase [Verrucomicrobiae bacterium]
MRLHRLVVLLSLASATAFADPIIIEGPEQSQIDTNLPDGGLPPVPGVQNIQIFRASHDKPELTDGKGWTYDHHLDMAAWKGRLYVAWTSTEKDEDVWPWREVYSTSTNGFTWSRPAELFPQGVSNPLRMYFFLAPNGRMLAIAGLRCGETALANKDSDALVVREILANHALGPYFTLLTPAPVDSPAFYTNSADKGFVEACDALLANRPFLEQQDRGSLLGSRRMKWHDSGEKNLTLKALSFFRRKDGALVGIAKNGWVTVSTDEGETWSKPVIPSSLVTGTGKVWGQRTRDGRYALVYNPDKKNRFPLVIVTGDDGVTFRDMRIVHGEVPPQRYVGEHKNVGPQYVRGVSEWSNDGSWRDGAMWVAYSVNKEDIWVSRIPLTNDAVAWNTYSPLWAPVAVTKDGVTLQDRDPYDYARASRLFPSRTKVTASFDVLISQIDNAPLIVTLLGGATSRNPMSWGLPIQNYVGKRLRCRIEADAATHRFSLYMQNERIAPNVALAGWATNFTGISFCTGASRPVGGRAQASVADDAPSKGAHYTIQRLAIQ